MSFKTFELPSSKPNFETKTFKQMKDIKYFFLASIVLIMSACTTETAENGTAKEPTSKLETAKKSQVIQTAKAKYHVYHSKVKPYTIQIPVEWPIKEHTKSGAMVVKAPKEKGKIEYQATIELNIRQARTVYNEETKKMEAKPMDLGELTKKYIEGLQRSYEEMKVEGIEDAKVGEEAAKVFTYTYLKESEYMKPLKVSSYLFHHQSETYILTFREEESDMEAIQPIFEEMKNSFRFE